MSIINAGFLFHFSMTVVAGLLSVFKTSHNDTSRPLANGKTAPGFSAGFGYFQIYYQTSVLIIGSRSP